MNSFLKYEEFLNSENMSEAIRAEEAHRDQGAIQTVIDGRRDIGWITLKASVDITESEFWRLIKMHDLKTLKVPENSYDAYIYYRKGAEKKAKELLKIANKYNGYLSYKATESETKRIGELLGYETQDIEDFIFQKYKK